MGRRNCRSHRTYCRSNRNRLSHPAQRILAGEPSPHLARQFDCFHDRQISFSSAINSTTEIRPADTESPTAPGSAHRRADDVHGPHPVFWIRQRRCGGELFFRLFRAENPRRPVRSPPTARTPVPVQLAVFAARCHNGRSSAVIFRITFTPQIHLIFHHRAVQAKTRCGCFP